MPGNYEFYLNNKPISPLKLTAKFKINEASLVRLTLPEETNTQYNDKIKIYRYTTKLTMKNVPIQNGDALAPHLWDWYFDGLDDYVTIASFDSVTSFPFAVEVLLNYDTFKQGWHGIVVWYREALKGFWLLTNKGSNTLIIGTGNGSECREWWIGMDIYCGRWLDIAVNFYTDHFDGYFNTNYLGKFDLNIAPTLPSDRPLNLGTRTSSYGFSRGFIGFVRIYNRSLEQDEISTNMNQHIINASGLVLFLDPTFWDGEKYVDLSGNGNDGIPYGGVQRVPAENKWLWLVKSLYSDNLVHLRFFPRGSVVLFVDPDTGEVVREVFVDSDDVAVNVPEGTYDVIAYVSDGYDARFFEGIVTRIVHNPVKKTKTVEVRDRIQDKLMRYIFNKSYVDASLDTIVEDIGETVGVNVEYDSSVSAESKTWDTDDELSTLILTNTYVKNGYINYYAKPKLVKTANYLREDSNYPCETLPPYNGWTAWYNGDYLNKNLSDTDKVDGDYSLIIDTSPGGSVGLKNDFSSNPFKFLKLTFYHKSYETNYTDCYATVSVTGSNVQTIQHSYIDSWLKYVVHADDVTAINIYWSSRDKAPRLHIDAISAQEWGVKITNIPYWIVKIRLYDSNGNFKEEFVPENGEVYVDMRKYGSPYDFKVGFVREDGVELVQGPYTISRREIWEVQFDQDIGEALVEFTPQNGAGWDKLDAVLDTPTANQSWEIYVLDENDNVLAGPLSEADLPYDLSSITSNTLKFKFKGYNSDSTPLKLDSITVSYYVGGVDISFKTSCLKALKKVCDLFGRYWWTEVAPIYGKRRKITITEQSGQDLTDYQVRIVLDSSNFDFAKAQPDGSDVYFLDNAGNPLYFWIEEWDSANQKATIWVKVPNIPANGTVTIYMYYACESNPYANYNDPENVFIFYDDFETDKGWTFSSRGSFSGEYTTEDYVSPTRSYKIAFPGGTPSSAGDYGSISIDVDVPLEQILVEAMVKDTYTGATAGYHFKQIVIGGTVVWEDDVAGDEGEWVHASGTFTPSSSPVTLVLRVYDKKGVSNFGVNVYWDCVRIRKYVSTEPSVSVGSENASDILVGYVEKIFVKNVRNDNVSVTLTDSEILGADLGVDVSGYANRVVFIYNGGEVVVEDPNDISNRGLYEKIVVDKDVNDDVTANQYAQRLLGLLMRKKILKLKVNVDANLFPGYKVQVNSDVLGENSVYEVQEVKYEVTPRKETVELVLNMLPKGLEHIVEKLSSVEVWA